jgi:hypothetical protein
MKRTTLFILATMVASAAYAGPLTSTRVKTIDVSTYFTSANTNFANGRNGGFTGGIAFDGTNAYVSGWRGTTDGDGRTGVLKINDVVGTHTFTTGLGLQVQTRGASRMSKLVRTGNSVYFGYGAGESSAAANSGDNDLTSTSTNYGLRKLDLSGSNDLAFSPRVSGPDTYNVVTPGEFQGLALGVAGARIDAYDYDSNNNEMLGFDFFKTKIYRVDASTGAFKGTYDIQGDSASGTLADTWRDMDYDPATKTLYTRASVITTVASRANRASVESFQLNTSTGVFERKANLFQQGAAESATSKVAFFNSSIFGSIVAINDTATKTVKVLNASTGALLMQVNGSENGGTAFSHFFLTTTFGVGANGKTYMMIADSASTSNPTGGAYGDRVHVYEVVPEPGTMIALGAGIAGILARRKKAAK